MIKSSFLFADLKKMQARVNGLAGKPSMLTDCLALNVLLTLSIWVEMSLNFKLLELQLCTQMWNDDNYQSLGASVQIERPVQHRYLWNAQTKALQENNHPAT